MSIVPRSAISPMGEIMTITEAQSAIESIRSGVDEIRLQLWDLKQRSGWSVLGYESFRECIRAQFPQHESYLYRQLSAAEVEAEISPIGEIGVIPEGTLRPLGSLEPQQQREAWSEAVAAAPNGKPTAKQVEAAAAKHRSPRQSSPPTKAPEPTHDLFSDEDEARRQEVEADEPDEEEEATETDAPESASAPESPPNFEAKALALNGRFIRLRDEIILIINGVEHEEGLIANAPRWHREDIKTMEVYFKALRDALDQGIRKLRSYRQCGK